MSDSSKMTQDYGNYMGILTLEGLKTRVLESGAKNCISIDQLNKIIDGFIMDLEKVIDTEELKKSLELRREEAEDGSN